MIHCQNCKWWGDRAGAQGNPKLRACSNPKHVMGYRMGADVPDNGILIESDEGWGMETGPLFGCVNGEAKPPSVASI